MKILFTSIRLLIVLLGGTIFVTPALSQPGSNDLTFDTGTGANGIINTTAIQSDGKIIIGGSFTAYDGTARSRIARLNSDGSLDAGFNPGGVSNPGAGADNIIFTTAVQSDGKIIIGGIFSSYNGAPRNRIARLNNDGSLDAGFNPPAQGIDEISSITIQNDGKIIMGGNFFYSYNGTEINGIARLNSDGSLDAGFNPGTGVDATIGTTAVQSDGKIIIGGDFTAYNGTAIKRIARLNSDGRLDAGFNTGNGPNSRMFTTAIQSDGKIIIGGAMTSYDLTERHKIARLNTDGSLDTGFNPGTGADRAVYTTAIQSDGKIIIGGDFTTYNGTARIRIARLNSDGSLDAGFNPGTGANYIINTTAIQSDGKIIIGGSFTAYNGTIRSRVARVIGGTSLSSSSDYFRTITSGNWNAPATWESAKDAAFTTGVVSPATLSPDFNAHTITIQNTHTVFITANITIGQTTLNSGGAIVVNPNIVLTVK